MRNMDIDIFNELRTWIIEGRFGEGQYISPCELCPLLKVSQIPVREVLIRLAERGLLTWERKRGFRIASCDMCDCDLIFQVKRMIFTNAIGRLCPLYFSPNKLNDVRDRIRFTKPGDVTYAELYDVFMCYSSKVMSDYEFHIFQISCDRIHEYRRRICMLQIDTIPLRLELLQKIVENTCSFSRTEALTLVNQFIDCDIQSIRQAI